MPNQLGPAPGLAPYFTIDATGTDAVGALTFNWTYPAVTAFDKWIDDNTLYPIGPNQKFYFEVNNKNTGGQNNDGAGTYVSCAHGIGLQPIVGFPGSFALPGISVFGIQLGSSDGKSVAGVGGVYNYPTATYPGLIAPANQTSGFFTTNYNNSFTLSAPTSVANDIWGICVDTANMKVWVRNITQDGAGNPPKWNFNSTDDPANNKGGISLATVDLTILPFPWYIYYTLVMFGTTTQLSGSGTLVGLGVEAVFNFGQNAYKGVLPSGFTNWPPFPNTPVISGKADKQISQPIVVPFHPDHSMTDSSTGEMTGVWAKFFQRESAKPSPIQILTAGINPYVFTANIGGVFWIVDPNNYVQSVTIQRGKNTSSNSMTLSSSQLFGPFPLANGDTISVFYIQPPQTLAWAPGSHSGSVP